MEPGADLYLGFYMIRRRFVKLFPRKEGDWVPIYDESLGFMRPGNPNPTNPG